MSRRLRVEQEYAKQLRAEAEEEDDKIKKQQEKIFAPIEWGTFTTGFRVRDVVEREFDDVIEIIKNHYVPTEVISRNSELEDDEVSLKSFLEHAMYTLKDSTSIVGLDMEKEALNAPGVSPIAGVLLLRVVPKSDFGRVFSRTILTDGEARKKYLKITTALNRRIDLYAMYQCDTFLKYCLLCVRPEYRRKNLGYQLMRIGLHVAKSLKIPLVGGIFTSYSLQKKAKRLKFELIQEVSYTNWRDKNNELVFSDPGAGNYSCALMAAVVPEEFPPEPTQIRVLSPYELRVVEPARTRLEKRAASGRGSRND